VYVIGRGKNEILLPAIREVVQSVDIDARRIVVTPTPGLMPGEAEEA
jgi:ribosomal 30S subunit maturation factor RimM